jgi:hypothetical protein
MPRPNHAFLRIVTILTFAPVEIDSAFSSGYAVTADAAICRHPLFCNIRELAGMT